MNEYVLRAFQTFKPRASDAWMFDHAGLMRQFEMQIAHFPAYALPSTDKPTALCGIVGAHGRAEVWMITGEGFERSAPLVLHQLQALCSGIYRAWNLHRLEMRTDPVRPETGKFAERVGFEYETTLQRAGPRGDDQNVYLWPHSEGRAWQ